MSLPHVILTVLSKRDATGYDITKEFSHNIGYFWKASHQQVYRELNKLAENGSVTCRLEPQEGKPDRKIYSITESGSKVLHEWFVLPAKHLAVRDEYAAKLLTCSVFDAAPMVQHVKELIDESERMIAQYNEIENKHFANYRQMDREKQLIRLTLRRNIHNRKAWLAWAREVLEELTMMQEEELTTHASAH